MTVPPGEQRASLHDDETHVLLPRAQHRPGSRALRLGPVLLGTAVEGFSAARHPAWLLPVPSLWGPSWWGSGLSCVTCLPSWGRRCDWGLLREQGHPRAGLPAAGATKGLRQGPWWAQRYSGSQGCSLSVLSGFHEPLTLKQDEPPSWVLEETAVGVCHPCPPGHMQLGTEGWGPAGRRDGPVRRGLCRTQTR